MRPVNAAENPEGVPSEPQKPVLPLRFVQPGGFRGEGRSRGLSRGLIVLSGEENITREGMGIGCPVLVPDEEPIFSRTCSPLREEEGQIESLFMLDTGLGWGIHGTPVSALTRLVNGAVRLYMRFPPLQFLLPLGSAFRSLLSLRPIWYEVPVVAEVRCTYRIRDETVDITCQIQGRDLPTIFLLNELGADTFSSAYGGGRTRTPPTGWRSYSAVDQRWLYDPARRIHFRLVWGEASEGMATHLFWGREHIGDLCWAGYGIRLTPQRSLSRASCRYSIAFDREGSS
jgi:hypothetical protein